MAGKDETKERGPDYDLTMVGLPATRTLREYHTNGECLKSMDDGIVTMITFGHGILMFVIGFILGALIMMG